MYIRIIITHVYIFQYACTYIIVICIIYIHIAMSVYKVYGYKAKCMQIYLLNMHWLIANYIVNCDWIYKNRPYGHM